MRFPVAEQAHANLRARSTGSPLPKEKDMKKRKPKLKRIKESITELEYKKLMSAVRGDESIRENTKDNLLRAFTILYFTGLRLNEL